jgi:hypothetical protein
MQTCQMTTGGWSNIDPLLFYDKCGRKARFTVPEPKMNVKFVCGIHARSLNAMYKRTGKILKCKPLLVNNDSK